MLKLDKQSFFFFRVKKGDSPGVANIAHTPEPELHNNLCVLNLFCILATRIDILYVINWLNWGFGLLPSQKTPVFSESSMAYLNTMMMCQCLLNKPPDYIGPFPVSTSTVFLGHFSATTATALAFPVIKMLSPLSISLLFMHKKDHFASQF